MTVSGLTCNKYRVRLLDRDLAAERARRRAELLAATDKEAGLAASCVDCAIGHRLRAKVEPTKPHVSNYVPATYYEAPIPFDSTVTPNDAVCPSATRKKKISGTLIALSVGGKLRGPKVNGPR
jgi:hypothetical protein